MTLETHRFLHDKTEQVHDTYDECRKRGIRQIQNKWCLRKTCKMNHHVRLMHHGWLSVYYRLAPILLARSSLLFTHSACYDRKQPVFEQPWSNLFLFCTFCSWNEHFLWSHSRPINFQWIRDLRIELVKNRENISQKRSTDSQFFRWFCRINLVGPIHRARKMTRTGTIFALDIHVPECERWRILKIIIFKFLNRKIQSWCLLCIGRSLWHCST